MEPVVELDVATISGEDEDVSDLSQFPRLAT